MSGRAIMAVGSTVTSGAASATVAIPLTSGGVKATRVRIMSVGNAYIKFGLAGVVATTDDLLLGANTHEDFGCGGYSHVAYLQETAATKINIAPLE